MRHAAGSRGQHIRRTIVTVHNESGGDHIAPMGVREGRAWSSSAHFRPSATLDHILREKCAGGPTDDVRIFAGCLPGAGNGPHQPSVELQTLGRRACTELVLERGGRPQRRACAAATDRVTHAPFRGFNRAQAA
jgi:hypothetical protein